MDSSQIISTKILKNGDNLDNGLSINGWGILAASLVVTVRTPNESSRNYSGPRLPKHFKEVHMVGE